MALSLAGLFIDRLDPVHINHIITTVLGPFEGPSVVSIAGEVEAKSAARFGLRPIRSTTRRNKALSFPVPIKISGVDQAHWSLPLFQLLDLYLGNLVDIFVISFLDRSLVDSQNFADHDVSRCFLELLF